MKSFKITTYNKLKQINDNVKLKSEQFKFSLIKKNHMF